MQFSVVSLYMAALYVGATSAPGVGILGRAISTVPQGLLEWSHAPIYAGLCWVLIRALRGRGWPAPYALTAASAMAFVFGIWMEIFQASVPDRTTSLEDLIHNGIGIGFAAISMWHLYHSQHKAKSETMTPLQPEY